MQQKVTALDQNQLDGVRGIRRFMGHHCISVRCNHRDRSWAESSLIQLEFFRSLATGLNLIMNPAKQHKKLERLQLKAEECTTREEAQKIIKKADKVHRKLTKS